MFAKLAQKKKTFTVVCGANNLYQNMKTVFAPNGSFIPGKNLKLEKKNIRGIEGDGMLCSEEELCLSDDTDGIIDLDESYKVGEAFGNYIENDFLFEIALTPNRGDCASVKGLARELAAKLSKKLISKSNYEKNASYNSTVKWDLSLLNSKEDCPLIVGREFRIEKNGLSPFYIRNRLRQIGVNFNTALVDITNYILFDLGRPLHVFDLDKITGNLKVRKAKNNEKFIGLDNKTYSLTEKDLVIADDNKVVSLAGIMGSTNSCVDENTKKVFLEVAYFDPVLISETGRRHNIITDARYRFERGVNKNGLTEGLEAATEMIISFCKGSFSKEVIAGKTIAMKSNINYQTKTFKNITGYDLDEQTQMAYLNRLGFETKKENNFILVSAPPWRHDIFDANDVVEEIVRLDGYEKIPSINITKNLNLPKDLLPLASNIEIDLKIKLASLGLNEIKSFTFISPSKIIPASEYNEQLRIVNPISSDLSIMRNTLYPNLLDTVSKNFSKGLDSFSLFEIGDIFKGVEKRDQQKELGIVLSGYHKPKNWHSARRSYDFFDMKTLIIRTLKETFTKFTFSLERSNNEYYHPGKSANIIFKNQTLGSFGELHPKLMKKFLIKQHTILGSLSIDLLLDKYISKYEFKKFKLSPLLTLKKDFSFILPKETKVEDLIEAIKNSGNKIGEVLIFDVYNSENNANVFSVGVEVEILQEDKVLNSDEINNIMKQIIITAEKKLNARLRSQ